VTAVPGPVERCGYTITPVLGRSGGFNPVTGDMRIDRDDAYVTETLDAVFAHLHGEAP